MADPFAGYASPADPFDGVASPVDSSFQGNLLSSVKNSAESGVKNIASFGSTEPVYKAETPLGKFTANALRPFRPAYGAIQLATAPAAAVLQAGVGKPVEDLTGSPTAGAVAQLATAVVAPAAARKAISALGNSRTLSNLVSDESGIGAAVNPAKEAFQKNRTNFVQSLITPKLTQKVKEGIFANSVEQPGLLNKAVEVPDPYQQQVINTVSQTQVAKGNSLLKNRMIIDKSLGDEANALASRVADSKVIYSPSDMIARLNQTKTNLLSDEPLLIGDGEKYLDLASAKMQSLVNQNPGTPAGLLKARKDFDYWANSKGGFGEKDTVWRAAVKGVRNTANDYIAEMVPTAEVKSSLTKQSHLFDARDAINSKGAAQAKTNVGRAVQKIDATLPGNKITRPLAATGAVGAYVYGSKK